MSQSSPDRRELSQVIELVAREATAYFQGLDDRLVRSPDHEASARSFAGPLPEEGEGAAAALRELIDKGSDASVASGGPRFFHFVTGGSTPAAFGADWIATFLDQMAYAWVATPLAVQLEVTSLQWLKALFALPERFGGLITTGATMANFVSLAAARQWWGERHDVDVSERGLAGLPNLPVFSSGHVHASSVKTLAMLGIGRASLRTCSRDGVGRVDLDAIEDGLAKLGGAPAIVIANAGEVNAGEFDPIDRMADLAERYDAWLHVDGAFGLFARVSPRLAHLAAGAERAHSVTVDGHKWLNVPYDCGFAFVHDATLLAKAFAYTAAYLVRPDDPRPTPGGIGPESSRRARSLAVWATLRAYGRRGCREMVEHHAELAQHLARRVDEADDLERLAEVPLNIVCFRCNPGGLDAKKLDLLNEQLGEAILSDGRVFAGTTTYDGCVALRPAIVNWRTREEDIDFFVDVVRELGAKAVKR